MDGSSSVVVAVGGVGTALVVSGLFASDLTFASFELGGEGTWPSFGGSGILDMSSFAVS